MIDKIHFGSYYGAFYRRTQFFMREIFKQIGLTFVDGIVLNFAYDKPGVIQDEIAAGLVVDKAMVTRSLKVLEKKGLLVRESDSSNQRVKRVFTTEAAKPFKDYFDQSMIYWNKVMLQDLERAEQDLVINAMKIMRDRAVFTDVKETCKEIKKIKNKYLSSNLFLNP